ncbi:protein of unknown function [Methylobacterium sp. 174MFSha1.1]|uniref:DUF4279 domain-containing protein n=1 Tax=Methylobacterium sp. 174MFSha1.1 TaxID=1502749 RepID=UPI0008E2F07F|nr:DUF4279 domain-containing protein [Methylobacterium sp. 174MFSha1.1]SFU40861.1 protein of unknown function [Methylobacterium sp. 174MFSha1.1]
MPEIARITVSLRIVGDALDPDEITQRLGVEPTGCARKGDTRRTASGREVIARSGTWLLRTDASGDLNTQIATLLAELPNDPSLWTDLSRRYRCDIFCGLFMGDINEGTELQPKLLSALGGRGLRLSLDIYGCSD